MTTIALLGGMAASIWWPGTPLARAASLLPAVWCLLATRYRVRAGPLAALAAGWALLPPPALPPLGAVPDRCLVSLSGTVDAIAPGTGNARIHVNRVGGVAADWGRTRLVREASGTRLLPGDRIEVVGRYLADRPPTNPGQRDRWGGERRLGLTGRVIVPEHGVRMLAKGGPTPGRLLAWLRHSGVSRLNERLGESTGGLAAALLLGARTVPEDLLQAFRSTGMAHLLVVSGLHVGMVAGAVWLVLRRWGLGPRAAFLPASLLTVVYVMLAGAQAPAVRAGTALVLAGAAAAVARPVRGTDLLAATALLCALAAPATVPTLSFGLSYTAAAGIVHAALPMQRRMRRIRLPGAAAHGLAASLAAWGAILPFTLLVFRAVAWTSLVATPLLAPLLPLVLASAAAAALASPAVPPARWILESFAAVVVRMDTLPGTPWRPPPLPAFFTPTVPGPALRLLDVGHGTACLFRLPDGRVLLFDAGSLDRTDVERAVLDALESAGWPRIDAIVVSHGDRDHDGAVPALLARWPNAQVLAGPGTDVVGRLAWQPPDWPSLEFLSASLPQDTALNERSLNLAIDGPGFSVLLMGDPEEAGLGALMDRLEHADVLLAPHHGLASGGAAALMATVRPDLVLVSAGRRFRPRLDSWAIGGARVLCTRDVGSIGIAFSADARVVVTGTTRLPR